MAWHACFAYLLFYEAGHRSWLFSQTSLRGRTRSGIGSWFQQGPPPIGELQQNMSFVRRLSPTALRNIRSRSAGPKESFWADGKHEPTGYLFNETPPPPGQSRKWESWEAPWCASFQQQPLGSTAWQALSSGLVWTPVF